MKKKVKMKVKEMNENGFDTDIYLEEQEKAIRERISKFNDKIYIEFGGKLVNDWHAFRVLKGYRPHTKIELLKRIKADAGFLFCVSAKDIINGRVRGDYKIDYRDETIRVLKECKKFGLDINNVVITLNEEGELHKKIADFYEELKLMGVNIYIYRTIRNYLNCSINELLRNEYIDVGKRIVVVTGAGGGSGKFGVCLTQLAHDFSNGKESGYAKFETFSMEFAY